MAKDRKYVNKAGRSGLSGMYVHLPPTAKGNLNYTVNSGPWIITGVKLSEVC